MVFDQKLSELIPSRIFWLLFACSGRSSLFNSNRIGFLLTSVHILLSNSVLMPRTSFHLNVMKPHFLQESAWVTSKDALQTHWNITPSSDQSYWMLIASQNSCLISSYPRPLIGIAANQFELHFWVKVSIFLLVYLSDTFTLIVVRSKDLVL